MRVLLVDDDRDLVELLDFALGRAGLEVIAAYDSPAALRLLEERKPDLVILDVNLGAWNGLDLLADLRRRTDVPVIMLTGRDGEDDKVKGLELGADDYVTKPFSHRELIARIRAHLRRRDQGGATALPPAEVLEIGGLSLRPKEHRALKDGQPLDLTVTEFRLLSHLMANQGVVVPTRTLLRHVWGYDDPSGGDLVRVTVYRLRRKVEDDPRDPHYIHTVPGVGVMLKPERD